MTTLSPLLDLDDADALVAADTDGALRSAALAGAQTRAMSGSFADGIGERLGDLRPRSVVFVAGGGRAERATALLVAAFGARAGVPLVRASGTPPWVGPLDVVVVCGDDAGDPRLAESTAAAVRRGAETILVTPDEGPLRSAAAGRAIFLPPRIAVREPNTLMRYVAAGVSVLGAVSGGSYRNLLPDLLGLADALDDEASRNHPVHEVFHNPAKSVAVRMSNRRVVFSGANALALEVARHGSEVMLRVAGVVCTAGELSEVIAASVHASKSAQAGPADYDPFFHDDQVDGPRPEAPVRVLVAASPENAPMTERRCAAVEDVEMLVAGPAEPEESRGAERSRYGDEIGEFESMALLATRLEMAAAYLHLMGGR